MNAAAPLKSAGRIQRLWLALTEAAERQLPALTRLRRAESLPIVLNRRRIYVLPTLFGLGFGSMLLVMALGALNYNNNPALLLTSLIAAMAVLSMLIGFRNLDALALRSVRAAPCHAGETLDVELAFDAAARLRESLRIEVGAATTLLRGRHDEALRARVVLPTQRRGYLVLPRIRVWTSWPYGLFRCWSWLNPQTPLLVFARPEALPPPLPVHARAAEAGRPQAQGEEFGALREYRAHDPLRLIAWKASARHDRLLVREPEMPLGHELVLDFNALGAMDLESRIARLTRWVLMAEEQRLRYTLHLPQQQIGPDLGSAHAYRCLRELALL